MISYTLRSTDCGSRGMKPFLFLESVGKDVLLNLRLECYAIESSFEVSRNKFKSWRGHHSVELQRLAGYVRLITKFGTRGASQDYGGGRGQCFTDKAR